MLLVNDGYAKSLDSNSVDIVKGIRFPANCLNLYKTMSLYMNKYEPRYIIFIKYKKPLYQGF